MERDLGGDDGRGAAGARPERLRLWLDEPAVIDGNLVSARMPKDLPAFGAAMLRVLAAQAEASRTAAAMTARS